MKAIRRLLSVFLLWQSLTIAAQDRFFLTEKVFVAPTEEHVNIGDTVYIIGQVLSSDYSDFYAYSRYIYVELIDGKDKVRVRQKIKTNEDGSFYTAVPIDRKSERGVYYLRAYTRFMQNRLTNYYPTTPLIVGLQPTGRVAAPSLKGQIFPEGGHFVYGHPQKAAVFLCDAQGNPIKTPFTIINSRNDTILTNKTSRSGLATIAFENKKGDKYSLHTSLQGKSYSIELPIAEEKPTMQVQIRNHRLTCQVIPATFWGNTAYHIYLYHNRLGLKELTIANGVAMANMEGCSPGLLSLWLTDSTNTPVAQRTLYIPSAIDSTKVKVAATCETGELPQISISDTLEGSKVFVRILPVSKEMSKHAFESLNFEGETYSPIPFPLYYFEEDARSQRNDLEAWLLSANLSTTNLAHIIEDSITYPFAVERGLVISGKVKQANGLALENGSLQIYNASNMDATIAATDSLGNFTAVVNDYADGTNLYIQAINKKGKTRNYIYEIDEPKFPEVLNLSPYKTLELVGAVDFKPAITNIDTLNVYQLDEVTIKAKPIHTDKAYEWFHQKNPFNYVGREVLERSGIMTVEDALRHTGKVDIVANFEQDRKGSGWDRSNGRVVMWRNSIRSAGFNTDNKHGNWLDFVVDGHMIDRGYEDLLSMSASDIDHIELVQPSDSRSLYYGAPMGYVEIKHKLFVDKKELPSNGITIHPLGLTIPSKPYEMKAPQKAGLYKVLIDIISPDRRVSSYVRYVTCVPKN